MHNQRLISRVSFRVSLFIYLIAMWLPGSHQVMGQVTEIQNLQWAQETQLQLSPEASRKMPAYLRLLPGAPKEFLRMKAKVIEIKALDTDDPIVGILVKSTGTRQELSSVGARVGSQIGDIFSVRIPISRLTTLANLANVIKIEPSMLRKFNLDQSIRDVNADDVHQGDFGTTPPAYNGFIGRNVIVGIFDTGIDWRHEDFINDSDGASRITSIWDQTLEPRNGEKRPNGFSYGVEYTRQHINDEIDGSPQGFVRTKDRIGHGTHVAGIAAGDGSATENAAVSPAYTYVGMAPGADIIMIRSEAPGVTSQLDAIDYLMKKSDEVGKPVVLNLSLGGHFGPHDGTELESQAIDAAINSGKINIVISAGNEGTDPAHGEYIHAEGTVASAESDTTEFVIPTYTPNSGGGNDFMIFNLWYQGDDRLTVKVVSPGGFSWSAVSGSNRGSRFNNTPDGAIFIDNASTGVDLANGDRNCLILIFDASVSRNPRRGAWKIIVTGATVAESGHYDDWLVFSQVGRESVYFDAASASVDELVGIPGVASQAITVAAYSTKTSWIDYLDRTQTVNGAVLNDLAYFSSPGPTRDDPGFITGRQKPDISGPGFGIISALSQDAPFQSSIVRNQDLVHRMASGTSMSAPHVTGAVALMLEKNPKLTPAEVKNLLISNARSDAFTGTVPNFEWGSGKLDILAATNAVTAPRRAVELFPSEFSSYVLAATTAEYRATVKNLGTRTDSYNLSAAGNTWATTFWNAAGTARITNSGALQPGAQKEILIRVAVPSGASADQSDEATATVISTANASISESATVRTRTPAEIPWSETFPSTNLDPVKWPVNLGRVEVNRTGRSEPSSPYSLNLNGNDRGFDEIHTQAINTMGLIGVKLEYFYQRTGNGDSPESGDDLWVDYLNSSGQWLNLMRYRGSGANMTSFAEETIILPADAHHPFLQLRFRGKGTVGSQDDDWFIDDISLTPPPDITMTQIPDPFDFTLNLGDSTTATITIGNQGQSDLEFQISDVDRTSTSASSLLRTKRDALETLVTVMRARADFTRLMELDGADTENGSRGVPSAPLKPEDVASTIFARDAISSLNGALLAAENDAVNPNDVQSKLLATGNFASVTVINVAAVTPTTSELLAFDAVMVWRNSSYQNPNTLGNNLADYVDQGGGVVAAVFELTSANPKLSGRWESEQYYVIPRSSTRTGLATLGTIREPGHPIMNNVSTFSGGSSSYRPSTAALTPGASLIANWSDGMPLIAVKVINGTRRADLGFFPPSSVVGSNKWDASTDGDKIMANALTWVAGASTRDWLTYSTTSGVVAQNESVTINVKISAVDLIPDSTYLKNIRIASNDPDENPVTIPASLRVNPANYFFSVVPTNQAASGAAGDTLSYSFTLRNQGELGDSYDLRAMGNGWSTTFRDAAGTTEITNTGAVAAKSEVEILVEVIIPDNSVFGATDTATLQVVSTGSPSLSRSATVETTSEGAPLAIPIVESFPTTTLDPALWTVTQGTPAVNSQGQNEPSAPYSLELKGGSSADEVETKVINLAGKTDVVLSYFYQNDATETGDELVLSYFDGTNWVELARHGGGGTEPSTYLQNEIVLPAGAYSSTFKFKFTSAANFPSDEWFVDDVLLAPNPDITVAQQPDPFDFTLALGDSTNGIVTIRNEGGSDLRYRISVSDAGGALASGSAANATMSNVSAPKQVKLLPDEIAIDDFSSLSSSGTNSVSLPFRDGFEDGNLDDWINGRGAGVKEATDETAAVGSFSFHYLYTENNNKHSHGIIQEFDAGSQPEYVSFYIRSASTSKSDAYFVLQNDNSSNEIMFFYASSSGFLRINTNRAGGDGSYRYNALQWYHIEFKNIDWSRKSFDYHVDGQLVKANIPFRDGTSINQVTRLNLYNFTANSEAWWDEIIVGFGDEAPGSWITATPVSGTVAPNNSDAISVKINTVGLQPDTTYRANIRIASNDVNHPEVTIPVSLTVEAGTRPIARFTITPASGTIDTTFNVDASGSSDDQTPTEQLEVRWDWENDGVWDTEFSTTKAASHNYLTAGTKAIKLEVKDTDGNTGTTTRDVEVTEPPQLPPPNNLTAEIVGASDVKLSWESPEATEPDTTFLFYDDGTAESGIQGNFTDAELAVRFTPDSYPVNVTGLLFVGGNAPPDRYGVRVYLDPTAANSGPSGSPEFEGSLSFDAVGTIGANFPSPITIENGDFYLSLYNITGTTKDFAIGLDTSSDALRSWLRTGPGSYSLAKDLGFAGNLIIRAAVVVNPGNAGVLASSGSADKRISFARNALITSQSNSSSALPTKKTDSQFMHNFEYRLGQDMYSFVGVQAFPGGSISSNAGRQVLGFNIYRSGTPGAVANGSVVGNVPGTTTDFSDIGLNEGTFFYQVTAVTDVGESGPSNEASVQIGTPTGSKISVEVDNAQTAGSEFWVDIAVSDVQNLFGVSFDLDFTNTSFVDVVTPASSNVVAGSFMGNDVVFVTNVDEQAGKVSIGISRKSGQGGIDGSGVVARVKFVSQPSIPAGTQSSFSLGSVAANDPSGASIPMAASGAVVTFSSGLTVWPGDTDNNGVVNQSDVLPLGLHWGRTGPPRATLSTSWMGHPAQRWTPESATYADANGNGTVNQVDVLAIGLNWGKTHSAPAALAVSNKAAGANLSAGAAIIRMETVGDANPGEAFQIKVVVDSVTDLFGISFELALAPTSFVQVQTVQAGDFLGNDIVFVENATDGLISVGLSRKAGQGGVDNSGVIAIIEAVMSSAANLGDETALTLQNVAANDPGGASIQFDILSGNVITDVAAAETTLPERFALHANYPNPFNPETRISFELPQQAAVRILVFDLLGRQIRTLVDENLPAGRHAAIWNGRDQRGESVASGLYVYQIQAGQFVEARRMLLLK